MARRPMVVGNWKMHTTLADAVVLANSIRKGAEELSNTEVVLCPPFVWLYPIFELLEKGSRELKLGAQNMYFLDEGAFTGEVSPQMLRHLVSYVILGHSERRHYFGETDILVNEKVRAALKHGLAPIVCLGEAKKASDPTVVQGGIFEQLEAALAGVTKILAPKIVIAYEPVWAIGTGTPASGAYADAVAATIREKLGRMFGDDVAEHIRILYGGSVDEKNAAQYAYQPDLDGVLAGGISLRAQSFLAIARTVAENRT